MSTALSLDTDDEEAYHAKPSLTSAQILASSTISAYDQRLQWETELTHAKGCKARANRCRVALYKILLSITPVWQAAIVILSTALGQFGGVKSGYNQDTSLVYGVILGGIVFLILILAHIDLAY